MTGDRIKKSKSAGEGLRAQEFGSAPSENDPNLRSNAAVSAKGVSLFDLALSQNMGIGHQRDTNQTDS